MGRNIIGERVKRGVPSGGARTFNKGLGESRWKRIARFMLGNEMRGSKYWEREEIRICRMCGRMQGVKKGEGVGRMQWIECWERRGWERDGLELERERERKVGKKFNVHFTIVKPYVFLLILYQLLNLLFLEDFEELLYYSKKYISFIIELIFPPKYY